MQPEPTQGQRLKPELRSRRPDSGVIGQVLAWALALGLLVAWASGWLTALIQPDVINRWVASAGLWGGVAVVGLMVIAVVASPLPSAPIALAAGAAYGHVLGTVLVVFGAELGAITAFLIARMLGRGMVKKWDVGQGFSRITGSQTLLMWSVFLSRLLPFVSFDAVSYAAGLSRLSLWRFALATFAGIVPASFLLAHFGSLSMRDGGRTAGMLALALGVMVIGVASVAALWRRRSTIRSAAMKPNQEDAAI